mmetsp:Transcript_4602/g.10999  ORF Transcript_4602/g.10999 Transcript_4602/m.10999 type:complete len:226 (-) Transcript_4602:261-938(-)
MSSSTRPGKRQRRAQAEGGAGSGPGQQDEPREAAAAVPLPRRRSSRLASREQEARDAAILVRTERLPPTRSEGPTPMLDEICFTLHIETTNTSPQRGMLLNRFEEPDSMITRLCEGQITQYDRETDDLVELSTAEKEKPGYIGETLTLESVWKTRDGRIVDTTRRVYKNTRGFFTVAEVVAHVVDFERIDRPKSKWFGGVDCHHVFWQGLYPNLTGDAFCISWGS